MTTALIITDTVISSIGEVANLYVVATELTAIGNQNYTTKFLVFEDSTKAVQVGFMFQNNTQIGTIAPITLGEGVEASTTSILKALKTYLQTTYGWTITEVTE